jgi:hypothetical protein
MLVDWNPIASRKIATYAPAVGVSCVSYLSATAVQVVGTFLWGLTIALFIPLFVCTRARLSVATCAVASTQHPPFTLQPGRREAAECSVPTDQTDLLILAVFW